MTSFVHKEVSTIPVIPNTKEATFGLNLHDGEITSRTYVKDIDDTVSSSTSKSFGTFKKLRKKLCSAYITHINNDPVFSTSQATKRLQLLY